jgi:Tfp pilus assembly protein PilE
MRKGFEPVDVMIVVSILMLLAAIIVPSVMNKVDTTNMNEREKNDQIIKNSSVVKQFEFRGYDVYSCRGQGGWPVICYPIYKFSV